MTKTDARTDRKAFVTLRFAGDDLDPRDISAILPVEPTRAHRKGEEFFAGEHTGKLRGRTGIWFLATDKLVSSHELRDHLAFVQKLLYPASGDDSRITKLREILEGASSRAHITCFWRGDAGETAPPIPTRFKSAIGPLSADIETDFVVGGIADGGGSPDAIVTVPGHKNGNKAGYVRDEDHQEYHKFCIHHIARFGRSLPEEIWHYTSAEGLVGILESGHLWSTQIACVNDTLEQRYFGDLVHAAVRIRRGQNTDPTLEVMWQIADELLSTRDFTAVGRFVVCFSEVADDLGQWRGYGGGECGYAVGFRSDQLLEISKARPNTALLPMSYDKTAHDFLVDDVLRMATVYFQRGIKRGLTDLDKWAREFLVAYATELDIFSCIIKHPKFSAEVERRIMTLLQTGEHQALEFRQKRTLLARHLPLDMTVVGDSTKRLPITRIYVGPGPSQQVSRISVGDLLLKLGYQNVQVELSAVPYRVP